MNVVVGLDPSEQLLSIARQRAAKADLPVDLMQGSPTEIPLDNDSVDAVVMTWTLCSILDPLAALREMRRVLKPGGALLFVEQGLSPEPGVAQWQYRLTPVWRHVSGDHLIRAIGFEVAELKTEYAHGPRSMTYM